MTRQFEQLLALCAVSASKNAPEAFGGPVDWEGLIQLAREQGVQAMAAYGIRQLATDCPQNIRNEQTAFLRSAAVGNRLARMETFQLLKRMNAAGIRGVLLKGYAVADDYAMPDCRISADSDILIEAADEQKACKYLRQEGFDVTPRWRHGHHSVAHHAQIGCVELHVQLYDEIVAEVWLGKRKQEELIKEPRLRVQTEDGEYDTLGYTDHLIFMTLHMMKHLIASGASISMLLDIAVFFEKHSKVIDSSRFWKVMDDLRYSAAVRCCLWAMIRYCGFRADAFPGIGPEEDDRVQCLMDDLENGGRMGVNGAGSETDGWEAYNRQLLIEEKGRWGYYLYMLRWNRKPLFVSREHLERDYPFLRDAPYLRAAAWAHRLTVRGIRSVFRGDLFKHVCGDEESLSEAGKTRMELFRRLGMMEAGGQSRLRKGCPED